MIEKEETHQGDKEEEGEGYMAMLGITTFRS